MPASKEDLLAITADFKQTFDSPHGKRVLQYLMKRTGFLHTSYVAGDPYTSAFNEGQRAIVIAIMRKLKVNFKQLEKDLSEEVSDVSI